MLYYKQKAIFWKRPRRKTEQNFDSEMIVSHHWDVNLEKNKIKKKKVILGYVSKSILQ